MIYDQWLFQLLNGEWHNPLFDAIIPYWRSKYIWIPFYIFLVSFLWGNFGKRGLMIIAFTVAMLSVSDYVSSSIVKPFVERVRPCNDTTLPFKVRELVKCGGGYSFTSSHATNHFAIATFLSLILGFLKRKWITWALFAWAASIAYGQVYVGVHYPLDVVAGAALGSLIGFSFKLLYWWINDSEQWRIDEE